VNTPLVEACRLARTYRRGRSGPAVRALDGVDLVLGRGGALGIAGGSGAGKSTLVRLLLGMERPDAGTVRVDGRPLHRASARFLRAWRRRAQLVPQDPMASLDPVLPVGRSVEEPLLAHGIGTPAWRRERVARLLEVVELPPGAGARRPHELSGGQRQRVALARALAPGPELLVLDEPVSALDVPLRGRILDLLERLAADEALSIVLVSHELEPLRRLTRRLVVLHRGRVVEEGPTAAVLDAPAHPYTRDLVRATTMLEPPPPSTGGATRDGCPYFDRCSEAAPRCRQAPPLAPAGTGRRAACWLPLARP